MRVPSRGRPYITPQLSEQPWGFRGVPTVLSPSIYSRRQSAVRGAEMGGTGPTVWAPGPSGGSAPALKPRRVGRGWGTGPSPASTRGSRAKVQGSMAFCVRFPSFSLLFALQVQGRGLRVCLFSVDLGSFRHLRQAKWKEVDSRTQSNSAMYRVEGK